MNNIQHICCGTDTPLLDIMRIFNEASRYGLPNGIVLITGKDNKLQGTLTEGDLRRAILEKGSLSLTAGDAMQQDPILFDDSLSIADILEKLPHELIKRNRKSSKYLSKIVIVDKDRVPKRVLDYHQLWEQRVASHRHLVVVGLGYVGLTMALAMADAGFLVTGVDIDENKLAQLRSGHSYIHEVGLPELLREQYGKNFLVASELPEDGDVYIISVGTPVVKQGNGNPKPVLSYLDDAANRIGTRLKRGNLVILRSTVPIGTCRNFVKTRLEELSGLKCGLDFHLAFAPERTAEGKALKELRTLPQVIGGYNRDSLEATAAIFRDLTPTIIRVDSLEAAEMAKLINNTFRDYVFAYANQMALIASHYNINITDVIKAANEGYPRDPVPLPSPGVGGPCLTKDPYIFASVAESFAFKGEIFERGRRINESMHSFVVDRVIAQLNAQGKDPMKCNVLVCGLAFKGNPETGDIRNSSAVEIAELLKGKVAGIYGYDPVAERSEIEEYGIIPVNIPEAFANKDVVLFLNNHKSFEKIDVFDMTRAMNNDPVIFDGWNLFRHEDILAVRPCTFMGLSFTRSSLDSAQKEKQVSPAH